MKADSHYGDDGLLYGLEEGDRVEFATSEMDGVWGIGTVERVIEDGYYVVRVMDDGVGVSSRDLFILLRDAGRFVMTGSWGSINGWAIEIDGTGITNAQAPDQSDPADWPKRRQGVR